MIGINVVLAAIIEAQDLRADRTAVRITAGYRYR
jgi:hypothetical protein